MQLSPWSQASGIQERGLPEETDESGRKQLFKLPSSVLSRLCWLPGPQYTGIPTEWCEKFCWLLQWQPLLYVVGLPIFAFQCICVLVMSLWQTSLAKAMWGRKGLFWLTAAEGHGTSWLGWLDCRQEGMVAEAGHSMSLSGSRKVNSRGVDWGYKASALPLWLSREVSSLTGSATFPNSDTSWRLNVQTHEPTEHIPQSNHSNLSTPS